MSNEASILDESTDFSLVLGGPLYHAFHPALAESAKPPMEWLHRRVAAMVTIPWLPLLILSGIAGTLFRGPAIPFPRDVGTQVRFLIALPLLIGAEVVVHKFIAIVVKYFPVHDLMCRFCTRSADASRLQPKFSVFDGDVYGAVVDAVRGDCVR